MEGVGGEGGQEEEVLVGGDLMLVLGVMVWYVKVLGFEAAYDGAEGYDYGSWFEWHFVWLVLLIVC